MKQQLLDIEEIKRNKDEQKSFEEEQARAFKQFMEAHFCPQCQATL